MPKFAFAVADVVEVPVKFTMKAKGVDKLFSFTLTATRMDQDDNTNILEENEFKFREFLLNSNAITGWTGQRLVLDEETNEPAPFSVEAFTFMLSKPGIARVIYEAYQKECGAKQKN